MDISDSEEKRKAAAGLIEKYYYQLRVGCGNQNCDNPNCASSGQSPARLSPDDAAARAILCVKVRTALPLVSATLSPQSRSLQARNTLCPLHTEPDQRPGKGKGKVAEEEEEEEAMEVCSEGGGASAGCSLAPGPSGLNVQAPPFCPRQTKGNYNTTIWRSQLHLHVISPAPL